MRATQQFLVTCVALATTAWGAPGFASDFGDPRCQLAEATSEGATLYLPPGGNAEVTNPPKRCNFAKSMSVSDLSAHPLNVPRLKCQRVTACGRPMHILRIGDAAFLAEPRAFKVVEQSAEREDRPKIEERAPETLCLEVTVKPSRAWLYTLEGPSLARTRITEATPLNQGAVVAACRYAGDFAVVWYQGKRGLIRTADLNDETCLSRGGDYFASTRPTCVLPAWEGQTTRTTYLYPLRDDAPEASRSAVSPGAEVIVLSQRAGTAKKLQWYVVSHLGRRGLMPADAVQVGALTSTMPTFASTACTATAPLLQTTCETSLPVRAWADPAIAAGVPRSLSVPAGVRFPLLRTQRDGTRVGSLLGAEVLIDGGACVKTQPGSFPQHLTSAMIRAGSSSCSLAQGRRMAPAIPVDRLIADVSEPAETLAVMLSRAQRVENVIEQALTVFGEAPLSIADFFYLLESGATDRLLSALLGGADGHLSALHRAVYVEYGLIEGDTPSPPARFTAAPTCDAVTPPAGDEADLALAAKAVGLGHSLIGREAYLDVLGRTTNAATVTAAMAGYRATTLEVGASLRAAKILRRHCDGATDAATKSDACWLGAMAAFDHGDPAAAQHMATKLAGFAPLSARKLVFLTAHNLATGQVTDPGSVARSVLAALSDARASCGDCSELAPQLELQLIIAAHDAEDYELAYELLLGLPAPMLLEHVDVVLSVLGAMGRYDEIIALLEAARWGAAGGIGQPMAMLFWGARALDEACSFRAANMLANGIETQITRRDTAFASLPEGSASADRVDLTWWIGASSVTNDAPVATIARVLPEIGALWTDGGTCDQWYEAADQLASTTLLDSASWTSSDDRAELAVPPALAAKVVTALKVSEGACRAALAQATTTIAANTKVLSDRLNELRIDLGDHIVAELESTQDLLQRLGEVARARFSRDASGEAMGRLISWGKAIRRLPWPIRIPPSALAEANALLEKRGEKPLGTLKRCDAAASFDGDAPDEKKKKKAKVSADEADEAIESGGERLDEAITAALKCLEEGQEAGLNTESLKLLIRYQPALDLAVTDDLDRIDLDELPDAIRADLKARAARNTAQTKSCCVSTRPGSVEIR